MISCYSDSDRYIAVSLLFEHIKPYEPNASVKSLLELPSTQ